MSALGQRLKEMRRLRGFSLRKLAAISGVSSSHLCGMERGRETASASVLAQLAAAYGVTVQTLTGGVWRPHPRALRPLRTRGTALRRWFRWRRPKPPESTLAVLCREAGYYRLGKILIERLRAQQHPASFWTAVKFFLHGQNGAEQVASLHLLDRAGDLEDIEPQHLRFHRPVLQDPGRRWIAIVLKRDNCTFLIYPQVTVKGINGQYPTLDFLVCVSDGQHTWFVDVEIDGPGHLSKGFRDAERDVTINMPVLRVGLQELDREDFVDRLLDNVMRMRLR